MRLIRKQIMVGLVAVIVLLMGVGSSEGEGPLLRWQNQYINMTWSDPDYALGPVDQDYAYCSLQGFGCYLQTYNNTPLPSGLDWVIDAVQISFMWYTTETQHRDDYFHLSYGIGDSATDTPPSKWIFLANITEPAGSPEVFLIVGFNVTEDRSWTFSDISNIWLEVMGYENFETDDDLKFWWSATLIETWYHYDQEVVTGDGDGDRDTNLLIAELIILAILLFLIFWFMRRVQHRFEREVQ